MVLFDNAGRANTAEVIRLALERAAALDCDIVAASTWGATAEMLVEQAEKSGFQNRIVIVRGTSSKGRNGANLMMPEVKQALEARGAKVVTAAHALSAGERGLSGKHKGVYPLEVMAETLRTFGAGVKVGFECAVMALNADEIPFGRPVVAIGGTHRGADSAIVVTPSYAATILETVVHEIICKPYDLNPPKASELTDWDGAALEKKPE